MLTNMFLKCCVFTIVLKMCHAEYSLLYGIKYGFKYINDELNRYGQPLQADTNWFEQPLDHFDPKETRTWRMKYFTRLTYQKPNGPVYFFIGGESAVSPLWTSTGIMYELAKETRGAMYVSEHRYYGESKPLNGTDAKTFRFLSSRQALADNANLIKYIKSLPKSKHSKVVVIGGSYAGNLAAWMKLLYPDLVDAAIASSGPVLAKTDFYEYLEKVNWDYEQYGTHGCLDKIRTIFRRYDSMFRSPQGIEQLKREENICGSCDMSKEVNKQAFFSNKVGIFMGVAQYGTVEKIRNHCMSLNYNFMNTQTGSGNRNCICYDFDEMIKEFYKKENEWVLAWLYQTCTEFGYYQTSLSNSQPFTDNLPLKFYIKTCSKLFGPEFDERRVNDGVEAVNELYGGRKPNVTNVVFTNGDLDPWSKLSILEDLSYNAPAVVIPRASHCRDLLSQRRGDNAELILSRMHIKYLIKRWLGVQDYVTP